MKTKHQDKYEFFENFRFLASISARCMMPSFVKKFPDDFQKYYNKK